ncbi:UNVERIFIED_ORG: hypothetical protein J2Y81_003748 [Paraburkholderia sediminicola]|jgi:hypothetical protein|nr:hypothetical protein [Paraburkholderia sediminicola]CAE6765419.1 hypothetical protein R20943_03611 [Paraburkholderia aspalathi]CAE6790021.1 hypothetical protein R69746_04684 [Paraburkholderia aspalathi]
MILHRVNVAPRDAIPAARANARRFCYRVLQRNPMGVLAVRSVLLPGLRLAA